MKLPELLCPAGSPEALEAALAAGADAVYLGGSRFNARMNAHNFDAGALREAVTHAHHMGGRVYLTLNTLLWDRELSEAVEAAYEAALCGVDALIIADMGAAALIRQALPALPLHASTQLSGHNAGMGHVLAPLGFSRFVIARETSLGDLATAVRDNPLEVEVFIHGALCVSHSGQCLFSSVVGGRSGNRGECAQPCRLPYGCAGCKGALTRANTQPKSRYNPKKPSQDHPQTESYPLSLKDLSLAAHVPALIEAGVSSLKIEGRMKSPGYVGGVSAVWRRLLDERRGATAEEMATLGDLFSREGFTDGYHVRRVDARMMGVRSEADKERTAAAERAAMTTKYPPRLPIEMGFFAAPGKPVRLTATAPLYRQGGVDPHMGQATSDQASAETTTDTARITVAVTGECPEVTEAGGLSAEVVERQLTRTGGTPYNVAGVGMQIRTDAEERVPSLPVSRLNALRREVIDALDSARAEAMPNPAVGYTPLTAADIRAFPAALLAESAVLADKVPDTSAVLLRRTARFRATAQITKEAVSYFDRLYLPLGVEFPADVPVDKRGAVLPPVIFDRDREAVAHTLKEALTEGIVHLLVGNLGHLPRVRAVADEMGVAVCLHADHRLNPANAVSAARLLALGFTDITLAPELTIPRMRDISRSLDDAGFPGVTAGIVYGRLPLMLLEKCAIRAIYADAKGADGAASVCRDVCGRDRAVLVDRMGKSFPVLREDAPDGRGHRNSVYNSLPLCMSDRRDELNRASLGQEHYLFTVETSAEVDRVIAVHRDGQPLGGEVRRMMK